MLIENKATEAVRRRVVAIILAKAEAHFSGVVLGGPAAML